MIVLSTIFRLNFIECRRKQIENALREKEERLTLATIHNDTEFRVVWPTGETRFIKATAKVFWDEQKKPLRMLGINTDITERKAAEEEIKQRAFYDPLTGLPNRRKLLDRLHYTITINHRANTKFAVFMMDLDKFKPVNDKLGHATGDELLKQVAHRMTSCLRDSDMVARLGGDEFVLVLENLKIPDDAETVALKLIVDLSVRFQLSENHCVQIGASIGISIYPQHGSTSEILMDHADTALYQAKDKGRGCFAYFPDSLSS
ncbi:MAG: diguanylate cyclase [Methylococcales bacterium]|nr:diguanylate cyclase [Methylococcales bacterium]